MGGSRSVGQATSCSGTGTSDRRGPPTSSAALAVATQAKNKKKLYMNVGAATTELAFISGYHVAFFSSELGDEVEEALGAVGGDELFAVAGREIYVWLPGGTQRSKLMGAIGRITSGGPATVRNRRTVAKLADMLD